MKHVLPIAGLAVLALAAPPASVQAEDYDIDCAVILCMAGGFPASAPCSAAHGYMMKRLKKGKPPFGTCAMSDGKAFTDYDLDMGIHYYCEAGLVMRWPDECGALCSAAGWRGHCVEIHKNHIYAKTLMYIWRMGCAPEYRRAAPTGRSSARSLSLIA
jgi:hypothetical protein